MKTSVFQIWRVIIGVLLNVLLNQLETIIDAPVSSV